MGRYLKLGTSSLQRNLLEDHCDHLGDCRDQSGVHLRSCNFLCAFVLAEEKRRKAVPDDVCTADGNSFFSCSSDLSVYLSAEKRCDQQPVGRREYRLDDRDAIRHVGCLHYDDLDECGYQLHFLLVGFRAVPQDLIESAYLDGAGVWARIWHVMLPMASPQIFFVLFLNIAISFRSFAQIKLLTGGGPANATKNLIYYIYENAIINGRYETACVQAIFLFGLILLFTSLQFALEKRFVHYQ